jgi:hypothetical protein
MHDECSLVHTTLRGLNEVFVVGFARPTRIDIGVWVEN